MNPTKALLCLLAFGATVSTSPNARTPTPAPLPQSVFPLPLADGQTATACVLPTRDGQAFLVYSTSTGQLGSYLLTPTAQPDPTPPIDPNPQPTPPVPTPTTALVVSTVTPTDPYRPPPDVTAFLTANASIHQSFTVAMVATLQPPTDALTWIGRSAGRPYPWTFVANQHGQILWQGQPPTLSSDFLAILAACLKPLPAKVCPPSLPPHFYQEPLPCPIFTQ